MAALGPVVGVPAATALAPEPPGDHHPRRERRWPVARLAIGLPAERHRHRVVRVDADQVHELERAHPEAAHQAHHAVDRRRLGDPLLGELQRLQRVGAVAAVDQEAGHVRRRDDVLAHRLAKRAGRPQRPLARGGPRDHLDQPHHGSRVEEVHPHHSLGPGNAGGDLGDRERRGVGREHASGIDGRRDGAEQLQLQFQPLRRGLDHELGRRELPEVREGLDAPARRVGLRSPHPALLHLAVERGLGRPQAALERLGHRVVEQRPGARDRGELRDARAHRPRAEHADGPGWGGRGAGRHLHRRNIAAPC